ncbi:MAG: HEAT repeat domain-containing protein, partial [Anaerolineales bacterium]|nr:HEAT repeat domain-containing protein [Anaerolineales bacterium]
GRCGRWRAADVLGRMKAKTAVPGLLMHLAAGGDDVRPAVAVALAAIGDPAALPGLRLAAAHDPLPGVRLRAQNAVERLTNVQVK